MTSRRSPVISVGGWILLVATLVLAIAVAYGVPVELDLDPAQIKPKPEHGYFVQLPERNWPLLVVADGPNERRASVTELFEDGQQLGPAHIAHASIRSIGQGRYSHWQDRIFFSTSDNSDPRTNGRRYVAVMRVELSPRVLPAWLLLVGVIGASVFVRWLRLGLINHQDFLLPVGLWASVGLAFSAVTRAAGIALWLLLGGCSVLVIWAIATTFRTIARGTGRPWESFRAGQNATLVAASLTITVAAAEAVLAVLERHTVEPAALTALQLESETTELERALESFKVKIPRTVLNAAARRAALITLPPELDQTPVQVEGARRAYFWHGALHVRDRLNMRRTSPFPARQEHVFRAMVVGDSLTYGQGIEQQWTYARQLELLLEPDYHVEILNLGVSGHQSEDILGKVRDFLPRLRPDLIIYGMCPNDFLPSGVGQYRSNEAYEFPLPESVETFFTDNSRLARLSEDAYNRALFAMGLRVDFFDDILDGFTGYQQRFARDVARMNELATTQGLSPVVAITLNQYPRIDSRGHRIVQAAEELLQQAGMDVIPMDRYYRLFAGQVFHVSRWEGHPNEVANAIWATMLDRHLRSLGVLRPFRKIAAGSTPE